MNAFCLVVATTALLVAVGAPRLALAFSAGAMLGAPAGLAATLAGSLVGSLATFAAVRFAIPRERAEAWLSRRLAGHPRLAAATRDGNGAAFVVLVRQIPAPGILATVLLALTPRISAGAFLAGTFLGFVPGASLAVLAGAGLLSSGSAHLLALPATAAAAGFAVLALVARRSRCRPREGAAE